jgi:hemerythrin-like domain-containing protein
VSHPFPAAQGSFDDPARAIEAIPGKEIDPVDPIQELSNEHRAVEQSLEIFERIVLRTEKGEAFEAEDLEHLMDFFQIFVDTCHHGKEEELLFPAIEDLGVSGEGGLIEVLRNEHEEGRRLVGQMRRELAAEGTGETFRTHAQRYLKMLRDHIRKEDLNLFDFAAARLSESRKKELAAGFEAIEAERVGPGKHQEFHQMLEELDRRY